MANKIKLLPEVVANQIAAGEVVERPASVVKEMMENAVDAGARTVKVNFREGGSELIQIVDDGEGMSPIDARMAFDRHATSKIRSVDDIYALQTFGFRGEALASIAAIAEVELRSRQEGDELGTMTEIRGGEFVGQTPVMCPVGSQFFVRNLFYNVPARRRFLEKPSTSATQIKNEFKRVALCYPDISFELYSNDSIVYRLMPATLAGRIVDVVGNHVKHNLLDVNADTSIASVTGYIGRPAAAKLRNSEQYFFVNGRYFTSPYLASAIMKAYEKLIPANTKPSFFLYLRIDTTRIDVNVHPHKTQIKFTDEEAVWQIINAAVRETLAKTGAVPMMDFDNTDSIEIPVLSKGAVYNEPRAMSNSSYNPFSDEYIDTSAFNPDVDFTGFDLPAGRPAPAGVSFGGEETDIPSADIPSQGADDNGEDHVEFVSGEAFHDGVKMSLAADVASSEEEELAPWKNLGAGGERSSRTPRVDAESVSDIYSSVGVAGLRSPGSPMGKTGFTAGKGRGQSLKDLLPIVDTEEETPREDFEEFDSDSSFEEFASGGESSLEFVDVDDEGGLQQSLDLDHRPQFSNIMPLGGGCVAALLGARLVVVDARRARERILYEDYMRMLGHGSSVSQQLLFPERLLLSKEEYERMEEHAVDFASLGFDLEFEDGEAVEVKGTPADMPADAVDQLLFELLQAFSSPVDREELRRDRIATAMARQASRSVPRVLHPQEAESLLKQLAATENFSFSPSGKAVLAEITTEDIRMKLG